MGPLWWAPLSGTVCRGWGRRCALCPPRRSERLPPSWSTAGSTGVRGDGCSVDGARAHAGCLSRLPDRGLPGRRGRQGQQREPQKPLRPVWVTPGGRVAALGCLPGRAWGGEGRRRARGHARLCRRRGDARTGAQALRPLCGLRGTRWRPATARAALEARGRLRPGPRGEAVAGERVRPHGGYPGLGAEDDAAPPRDPRRRGRGRTHTVRGSQSTENTGRPRGPGSAQPP